MAEATTEVQQDATTPTGNQSADSSAETINTETVQADATTQHMIPKARFDELNSELKKLRAAQTTAEKEREKAEQAAAAEQGKFKELWEAAQAKAEEAERKAQTLEMSILRGKVAQAVGLPAVLAERLQGATEEELTEDAKSLLAAVPKPSAPDINSTPGGGNQPGTQGNLGGLTPQEFAAIYGVDAKYLNN